MASAPSYAAVNARNETAIISTANTNADGTGTGPATAIWTAPAAGSGPPVLLGGSKIEEVVVQAVSTTSLGMVRIYLWDGTGTDAHLYDEFSITAIPSVGTVARFRASHVYDNFIVKAGWAVTASTHIGESFRVHIFGGDF